ncbi:MAG: alpha/beta fold hydrolase [Shewanella sp.]|nr:alpha/beta fold hydrolase [Shewanella sp.]MCF1430461.1 alpha/beta fold hydrolase [Shewanella sp.]MCF1437989.1 alpha/beta fold hydrolase [Shewanella sp.]MCF1456200.1 alpha/beta fold hydrolase [Shewanella sp.]
MNSVITSLEPELKLTEYPYESRYFYTAGHRLHYLDEGQGDPVVMLHGNPSWSYYYRNLVSELSPFFRCIAPDHIGCGLSDKPDDKDYDYHLAQRIDDLDALLTHLGVTDRITLVLHDWGGMIGMGYAARYPQRINRLVLLNTAAFHLPASKSLPVVLKICRSWPGTLLIRGLNAFSSAASIVGVKRHSMSTNVRRSYVAPYNSWKNRIATLRFVQDIPLKPTDRGYELVSTIEASLSQFEHTPTLVCWGLKDFVFDRHFLKGWKQRLPHARYREFSDCGHYILEDASEEVIAAIRGFLSRPIKPGETSA